jgi:hypothetical protein
VFPPSRGILVSFTLPANLRERADECRGAIGAWIKNVEQLEEADGPNSVHVIGDGEEDDVHRSNSQSL